VRHREPTIVDAGDVVHHPRPKYVIKRGKAPVLTAAVVGMDNAVAHTVDSRVELSEGRNMMPKRTTLRLLDRVVAKGDRSKFIDRAVRSEFARTTTTGLRRALAEGYRRCAEDDRRLAAEWDHLSAEAWARLDHEEEHCGSVPH